MARSEEKEWLNIVKAKFVHPAIVLWRAVELKHIASVRASYSLEEPLLDLGCAEGNIADMLFKERKILGLDNCWQLLSQNRKWVYKALVLADACRMPYKNEQFGSIFSNCVIEHIPDISGLLNEAARILKKGGIFLFTVPSHNFADFLFFTRVFKRLGLAGLANWYKKDRNMRLNHFHCYDHQRWKEVLKEKGLNLLEYRYYMPEAATSFWDFSAALVLLFKIIPLSLFSESLNKSLIRRLGKYYDMDSCDGGGLLIIAQKGA